MNKKVKNLLVANLTAVILLFGLVIPAQAVNLQDAFNGQLSTVGTRSGFNISQNNVEPIIGTVISVVLSFLGVIFLILMVYGGYTWMTAAGNEEKVTKAKQLIQAAILGLLIVVGAYAITIFVMGRLAGDLIPGNDSGGSIQSGGVYDPTGSGGETGCCEKFVGTSNGATTCTDDVKQSDCLEDKTTRAFLPGRNCAEVSSCVGGGCCIETHPPVPPALKPTYTCIHVLNNAFCDPAKSDIFVYQEGHDCWDVPQCPQ